MYLELFSLTESFSISGPWTGDSCQKVYSSQLLSQQVFWLLTLACCISSYKQDGPTLPDADLVLLSPCTSQSPIQMILKTLQNELLLSLSWRHCWQPIRLGCCALDRFTISFTRGQLGQLLFCYGELNSIPSSFIRHGQHRNGRGMSTLAHRYLLESL